MGGRVTSIAVNPNDTSMFWIGFATGGVAKTVNNGTTFEMQFTNQATSGVGDLEVAPSNPNILWLGSGEANPRNSVSYGDGVYKSVDGGATWTNMGLKGSFQIGKIMIHPTNPDIVYVGALGRLWGPNEERGLFKTTDGGKSWSKVLYVNNRTGVVDGIMHPKDPNTMIVAMWERQRDMFDSTLGVQAKDGYDGYDPSVKWGPGAGMYKTTDGGKSWRKLGKGLPTSHFGRIGLDYWAKDPKVIFALIDCENIAKGTPPPTVWLGVDVAEVEGGVRIRSAQRNGPAEKASLKTNDVISAVDGKRVFDLQSLTAALIGKKAGDTVEVEYTRDKTKSKVTVTLATQPRGFNDGGPNIRALLGASADPVDTGLRLARIRAESPAAKAGLLDGDILTSFGGKVFKTTEDLTTELSELKPKAEVDLKVTREGKSLDLKLKLDDASAQGPFTGRPYTFDLGGQRANIQDLQGPNSHEYGGVYRSDDGGESWKRINSLHSRPMYFSKIKVDPKDDKNIYVAGVELHQSTNFGRTFTDDASSRVHSDHHAIWVNPNDPRHIILGTDGGIYVTYDRTNTWRHLNDLALGQFYHVSADNSPIYKVYGGLQDNGSWGGPNRATNGLGTITDDWINVGGGDGFTVLVDPFDADIVYSTSQNGAMSRRNLRTGEQASVRPPAPAGTSLRFNWHTPFLVSRHNPGIFYSAAQFVFRSVKRGEDARPISPDITRSKRGSASSLAESPRNQDVLWVGSDDGALHVTRDGGKTWTSVYNNLGVKQAYHVKTIEASRAAPGRAYVTLAGHWSNDDNPLIFVTEDFGATFKPIANNLPMTTTRCLREDTTNPNVLYCGTEIGVFVSVDRGGSWTRMGGDLPTVPVYELFVHPTEGDLIAATHGRSIWIADVSNLRQVSKESLAKSAALYAPKATYRWRNDPQRGGGTGHATFYGENPPTGVELAFSLGSVPKEVTLRILDIQGALIRQFNVEKKTGLQILQWDLRASGRNQGGFGAALVGAGNYRLVLTVDGSDYSQVIQVLPDPRIK
jgi:photosystem II stability/assembly factor-like uncharacterized protein